MTVWRNHAHNVWEIEFYPHTHTRVCPLFPRTIGNLPLKTPIHPSIQPLPNIHQIHTMKDDKVTNMSLANAGLVAPCSHNLQITSQFSRQINNSVGANEVALWAHHPYIGPFSQLPHSVTGAQRLCFLISSQLRDPNPSIYTFTFPRSSSSLFLEGSFFSRHVQVCILTFSFIK
jgi:hypothetical protein